MASRLTDRQKKFIDEYLIDLNATQAAIRAGYSKKNAFKIGSELLQKTTVQKHLQKRREDLAKRTEITQDRVLKELAAIGFADVTDFVRIEEKDGVDLGGRQIKYKAVELAATDQIPAEKRGALSSIKQGANGIEVKLHDKVKALELLGKYLGIFDKKEAEDEGQLDQLIKGLQQNE